jgi:hypothetical protein
MTESFCDRMITEHTLLEPIPTSCVSIFELHISEKSAD